MAGKSNFTADEWQQIAQAPFMVAQYAGGLRPPKPSRGWGNGQIQSRYRGEFPNPSRGWGNGETRFPHSPAGRGDGGTGFPRLHVRSLNARRAYLSLRPARRGL